MNRSCSVVIAAYDERRLPLLERAVASAAAQSADVEVVVAIDNNPALLRTVRGMYPGLTVVLNDGQRGASATRNAGARAATGGLLAFLDDDAEAAPGWLDALVAPLRARPDVVGVGGWIDPDWVAGRPAWFPMEYGWVVGASYTGLPTSPGPVRNVWSENMAVRAADFWAAGGFRDGFGKVGDASRPEDTELCLRMAQAQPGGTWWIEPAAVVRHHVPVDRSTPGFFWRRCRAEGAGKAALARIAGADEGLSSERDYTTRILPRGVRDGILDVLRGRPSGLLRAVAIVLGLVAAAVGFAEESVRHAVRLRRRTTSGAAHAAARTPVGTDPARTPGVPTLQRPARVVTVDVARPLPSLGVAAGEPDDVLVVVTLCGRPVGMVVVGTPTAPAALAARISAELGDLLVDEAPAHGLVDETIPAGLTSAGLPHRGCPVRAGRGLRAAEGPGITVAICTRNRPAELRRLLASVAALDYTHRQVVVVDNAPEDTATEKVCRDLLDLDVDYVLEPVPGLSQARNRAVLAARHELIAFLDDDEVVDPHWLSALAEEFADPEVAGVTGLVLPAELSDLPQVRFEQFGGHSKGRGFVRVAFDREHRRRVQSPLFPRPTFGAGANMAFRVRALEEIGGFDTALGAGTATGGGEDTLAFTEVMLAGGTIVYTPAALTWHYHRGSEAALAEQLAGYSLGIGAYYAALLTREPLRVLPLSRTAAQVAGRAVVGVSRGMSRRVAGRTLRGAAPAPGAAPVDAPTAPDAPTVSAARRVLDLATGPLAYRRARRVQRERLARAWEGS